ncbi:hypothetical protein EB001_23935 [bacterium]|nr:hypothetical protein [bacterium]
MNERIRELAEQAQQYAEYTTPQGLEWLPTFQEKFALLIVRECVNICMEMAAKCAGLPGDGALAKDCAHMIEKDFGVEE